MFNNNHGILRLFISFGCLFVVLLLTSCSMTVTEYGEFKELSRRHIEVAKQNTQNKRFEYDKALDRKDGLLKEKKALEEEIRQLENERKMITEQFDGNMGQAREAMASVKTQIDEQQDVFFDIRVGSLPRKGLAKQWEKSDFTLLVDMGNEIQGNGEILGAEVYSSKGWQMNKSNELQVIVFNSNERKVRKMSRVLSIGNRGRNVFRFFDTPLVVSKGDRVGLLLFPGTSIDYDEIGLGNVATNQLGKMDDINQEQHCGTKNNKRFAFSILGTSEQEYVALVKKEVAPKPSALRYIEIAYGFSGATFSKNQGANNSENKELADDLEDDSEVSIPFYVAAFHKNELHGGQFEIIGLSERLVISAKSKELKYVRYEPKFHFLGSAESFSKGDYCALVFSPGVHAKELHFLPKTYIKLEKPFDPMVPEMVFDENTLPDATGFSYDKNINIDFRINWDAQ